MTNDVRDSVVIERTFDAPIELVWRMWTDPDHFKAWYGPTGASVPVAKMDVRVGGARLVCMEVDTPSGQMQMWLAGEFLEVVENRRLIYTESMSDEGGNVPPASSDGESAHAMTEVRVELEDLGARTRMILTHVGIPSESPGSAGWAMALDKLAAYTISLAG
ncbi:MAG TPA: SRPBCC domain-containing protein [Actinomycetota bacterium]